MANKVIDAINRSIKDQVSNATSNATFNKTRTATIIKKSTWSGNLLGYAKYDINLDGVQYTSIPVYGNATFNKGDGCKVVLPNNQTSQMFILGIDTFPIGGIYMNIDKADPTEIFYGKWSSLGTLTIGTTTVYAWQRIA